MYIKDVRCEYQVNPVGIDVKRPRICWKLESDQRGTLQSAYQIEVSTDEDFYDIVWDSGEVASDSSIHVELHGLIVSSRQRYYYRVKAWDQAGQCSDWSETSYFEMGLLDEEEWQAKWIASPLQNNQSTQSPTLRKSFRMEGRVRSARIYATALGLYELKLNGARVGDMYFTPGWTNYNDRLQYQIYDVTDLLAAGDNVVCGILGNGWYKGYLGWDGKSGIYGDRLALLFQMHIEFEDGSSQLIVSDEQWTAGGSPILMSEIYHGETYDARLEQKYWDAVKDAAAWTPVEVIQYDQGRIVAQENEPVRIIEQLNAIEMMKTPKGELVIDMGQNMVGWVRFQIQGKAGQTVQIKHAEILDADGNFYIENLRTAKQTITYTLKGEEVEWYEPTFTFQGFRYIQLIGFDESAVSLEHFTGVVLHSDMQQTGSFTCSDPLVNQLQHNIVWGMKGNFLDVPTDCPQRDERLGWTGDAQIFIRTSAYLMQVTPFFTKWLRDLKSEQSEDKGVPFIVPNILGESGPFSASAWGDAAVICPWTLYICYGDKRILEEQYESMRSWVEYIRRQGDDEFLWSTGFQLGDWLALDAKQDSYFGATDRDLTATAYYAYSTSLLQKSAAVLGKMDDARVYQELHNNIVEAFQREFVTPAGRLAVGTQTGQVIALMFDLLQGRAKDRAVARLMELLKETKYHLTTGFVGTPFLTHVLSEHGHNEAAYKLLLQQDYPSWLYQVTKGATTIWEHWDGIKTDGSFWSSDMNSFNHYAYGAIGDWLYRKVAGINLDETAPAYKRIIIKPQPGPGLDWAEGKLETLYGTIRSYWKKEANAVELQVTIPANTQADILLPQATENGVKESGKALDKSAGVTTVLATEEELRVTVGSGSYSFTWEDNTIGEVGEGNCDS